MSIATVREHPFLLCTTFSVFYMFELNEHILTCYQNTNYCRQRGFVMLALYENLEINVQNMQILPKVDRTTREPNLL
jgi:hypothetical protein